MPWDAGEAHEKWFPGLDESLQRQVLVLQFQARLLVDDKAVSPAQTRKNIVQ